MSNSESCIGPIGVFDSGYGGLTILRDIRRELPYYSYIYIGDNARAPYGTRSFDIVYKFTLQAVERLFSLGCRLVILACNTVSAKALRTIQQVDLPRIDPSRRVLGVIRPSVEALGGLTHSGHIGVFGTPGTVKSGSYNMEIDKLYPGYVTVPHACPMWVPLVENKEADRPGADYFVKQEIDRLFAKDSRIDTVLLACTHYPLLINKIRQFMPGGVTVVPQGVIVARSLADYLKRHPEMERVCARGGRCDYYTTESSDKFSEQASMFMGEPVAARHIEL